MTTRWMIFSFVILQWPWLAYSFVPTILQTCQHRHRHPHPHRYGALQTNGHYYVDNSYICIGNMARPMGGYYTEPDSNDSQLTKQQHMIFGVPCMEETIVVAKDNDDEAMTIINLTPVKEYINSFNEEASSSTKLLLQYIQNKQLELKDKTIVEVGCSAISMAAAMAWGARSVTICHADADRLRLWFHAYQFFQTETPKQKVELSELTFIEWKSK